MLVDACVLENFSLQFPALSLKDPDALFGWVEQNISLESQFSLIHSFDAEDFSDNEGNALT